MVWFGSRSHFLDAASYRTTRSPRHDCSLTGAKHPRVSHFSRLLREVGLALSIGSKHEFCVIEDLWSFNEAFISLPPECESLPSPEA